MIGQIATGLGAAVGVVLFWVVLCAVLWWLPLYAARWWRRRRMSRLTRGTSPRSPMGEAQALKTCQRRFESDRGHRSTARER